MTDSATAQAASKQNRTSSAGAKVTVACKMETGLRLRVYLMREEFEPSPSGSRPVKIARLDKEVWVNGVGKRLEAAPRCEVVAGYALSQGIDKDIWDRWIAVNIDSDVVVNDLIYANEDTNRVRDWCREHEKTMSGTAQLSGGDDPRAPRSALIITDEEGRAKAAPRIAA